MRSTRRPNRSLVVVLAALAAACSETEATPVRPTVADVQAKLALADRKDGTTDKIVGKCAGCALGMDGKAAHALDLHGYTLHFCAAGCKTGFATDADAKVMALKID
jgi:hypothetical protein